MNKPSIRQEMELWMSNEQDNPLCFWNKPDEFENEKRFEDFKLDVKYEQWMMGTYNGSYQHIGILSVMMNGVELYPLLYSIGALDFIKKCCMDDIEHKKWMAENKIA